MSASGDSDKVRFLEEQERRLLAIPDRLDSEGYSVAARAVMRAAERVSELKLRALEKS